MEDDDVEIEVDDFNFDNILNKEEGRLSCYDGGVLGSQNLNLLQCEYGLSSQWLLDNTSQPCWYSAADDLKSSGSYDRHQNIFSNSLTDTALISSDEGDGWNEKEKHLLDRGLELFGKSPSRLAQFIGSKSPQQVRSYLRSRSHSLSDDLHVDFSNGRGLGFAELIDDYQIPVSVEEVIATVSTAQPTIATTSPKRSNLISDSEDAQSIYKTVNNRMKNSKVFKKKIIKKEPLLSKGSTRGRKPQHMRSETVTSETPLVVYDPASKWHINVTSERSKEAALLRNNGQKCVLLSSGEEIIRLKKDELEEEDEIEIGDADDAAANQQHQIVAQNPETPLENDKLSDHLNVSDSSNNSNLNNINKKQEPEECKTAKGESSSEDPGKQNVAIDLPIPTEETPVDPDVITENEKVFHSEFFEGRSVKTPSRYLKIRNHILECWYSNRPLYLTKTFVRTGLKSCGDVNSIGRVHTYLEQIGAINFGCEQVKYVRPLYITSLSTTSQSSSASGNASRKKATRDELNQVNRVEGMRQRRKKMFPDCWAPSEGEGGCTITHSEDGRVIHTEVFSKEPVRAEKMRRKVEQHKLVYCSKFDESNPPPFSVELNIESLLIMDLHAHSSHSEVIGLLGGCYDSVHRILHIYRSHPCRSSSSGVHCEMCPVSQKEVSEKLQDEGYDVVGWYHSHPTFFPNPSLQDLDTQSNMQTWLSRPNSPFVSFILSPYCPTTRNIGSDYRCLIVERSETDRQGSVPYRLPVEVVSAGLDVDGLICHARAVLSLSEEKDSNKVDLSMEYKDNFSYSDKCIGSAKYHLSCCKPLLSDAVITDLIVAYSGIMDLMMDH